MKLDRKLTENTNEIQRALCELQLKGMKTKKKIVTGEIPNKGTNIPNNRAIKNYDIFSTKAIAQQKRENKKKEQER